MANILIASLCESPIVVTAMVKTLKEKKNIELDKVVVLYPACHPNIRDGVDMIKAHCLCESKPYGLPFHDVNTHERCHSFLRSLHELLETHQMDTLYLSLAGDRKNMPALMFLFAPFYENIKGIYHILDRNERTDSQKFYSMEELSDHFYSDAPELGQVMNPPSDDLELIEIPFEHFAKAEELREILKTYNPNRLLDGVSVSLDDIEPDAMDFWAAIFQKKRPKNFFPERNSLSQKAILLAAVCKSPMVVTQGYTLLQRKENVNIDKVAVVFPEKNGIVKNSIRMIKDVFRKKAKETSVIEYGAVLEDVASEGDCNFFLNRIVQAIDNLREEHPDSQIRLLLSGDGGRKGMNGGSRKGMTALSYFAAQRSGITKVYHTLITDSELEERIESECSIKELGRLGSKKKKAERMFLECYPSEKFDLFEIPVIPLRF